MATAIRAKTYILFFCFFSFNLYSQKNINKDIDSLLNKHDLKGSILILNKNENKYYCNNYERANKRFTPASTFKIPNTLIALEIGVVTLDRIFVWDKKPKSFKTWEKDMNISEAFRVSCVPIYKEIAREVGVERNQRYISDFNYGKMYIDKESIDNFWLEGASAISQVEQVEFLQKLYDEELPLKRQTMVDVKKIMINEQGTDYILRAKTGTNDINNEQIGWYVGWLECKDNVFYFALNVEPKDVNNMSDFLMQRKNATKEILSIFSTETHFLK